MAGLGGFVRLLANPAAGPVRQAISASPCQSRSPRSQSLLLLHAVLVLHLLDLAPTVSTAVVVFLFGLIVDFFSFRQY